MKVFIFEIKIKLELFSIHGEIMFYLRKINSNGIKIKYDNSRESYSYFQARENEQKKEKLFLAT